MSNDNRDCNQCGESYPVRTGVGGGSAHPGDERFPYSDRTLTGVRDDRPWWINGAYCNDQCYSDAYYEPPFPYGPA